MNERPCRDGGVVPVGFRGRVGKVGDPFVEDGAGSVAGGGEIRVAVLAVRAEHHGEVGRMLDGEAHLNATFVAKKVLADRELLPTASS